jgi:hypothetical protein
MADKEIDHRLDEKWRREALFTLLPKRQALPELQPKPPENVLDNSHGKLSREDMILYQKRMRIKGTASDCGTKALLDMESLAEETIPMATDTATYYRIQDWMKNVAPKSGRYDNYYPQMSFRGKRFTQGLMDTVDAYAFWAAKEGEPPGHPAFSGYKRGGKGENQGGGPPQD